MKTIRSILFVALTVAALFAIHWLVEGMFATHRWERMRPSDWAAWVQAAGATAGIAIAIYMPWKQKVDAAALEEKRRQVEARRLCISFRDELALLQRSFAGSNIIHLLEMPAGAFFGRRIPVPSNRFPIYNASVGRLGEIDDEEIRHAIILSYGTANALMEAGFLNNQLLTDHRELEQRAAHLQTEFDVAEVGRSLLALQASCMQMQQIAKVTMENVGETLKRIDAHLG